MKQLEELWENFDAVFFDCDGVLYQSDKVLPGAIELVNHLITRKMPVRIVTNSSTKTRMQLRNKLNSMGFHQIQTLHCYPSGYCAAEYLRLFHPHVRSTYVIGESGLVEELQLSGFQVSGGPCDDGKIMNDAEFIKLAESGCFSDIDALVVGYDQSFNYYKLAIASLIFQCNPACILIGTNPDLHDRIGGKWLIPVNGCALAAVSVAINNLDNHSKPLSPIITGKPNPVYGNLVLKASGLAHVDPSRVLMIGDKIETDIRFAKNCGFKSLLVLSGCATDVPLLTAESDRPDFVLKGLKDMADLIIRD